MRMNNDAAETADAQPEECQALTVIETGTTHEEPPEGCIELRWYAIYEWVALAPHRPSEMPAELGN